CGSVGVCVCVGACVCVAELGLHGNSHINLIELMSFIKPGHPQTLSIREAHIHTRTHTHKHIHTHTHTHAHTHTHTNTQAARVCPMHTHYTHTEAARPVFSACQTSLWPLTLIMSF